VGLTGDYMMKLCWAGNELKRCPVVFCIMEEEMPEPMDTRRICPEKVVVLGPGLSCANCNEEAEFIIDGSNAGPGR